MMIQSKTIIAILAVVAVVAVGVTVVVKVVGDDNKTGAAVQSAAPVNPSEAPYGGRGQPRGEVKNSPGKEF